MTKSAHISLSEQVVCDPMPRGQEPYSSLNTISFSLAKAMEFPCKEARIVCHASYPQNVLYANAAWTKLTGFEQHEIEGQSLSRVHGPLADKRKVDKLLEKVRCSGFAHGELVSYKKTGSAFAASITIYPVISRDFYGDFILTHFVAVISEISSLKHVGGSSRSTSASSISQLTETSSDYDNEDETSSVSTNQAAASNSDSSGSLGLDLSEGGLQLKRGGGGAASVAWSFACAKASTWEE
eukprot:gene6441-7104_t